MTAITRGQAAFDLLDKAIADLEAASGPKSLAEHTSYHLALGRLEGIAWGLRKGFLASSTEDSP